MHHAVAPWCHLTVNDTLTRPIVSVLVLLCVFEILLYFCRHNAEPTKMEAAGKSDISQIVFKIHAHPLWRRQAVKTGRSLQVTVRSVVALPGRKLFSQVI